MYMDGDRHRDEGGGREGERARERERERQTSTPQSPAHSTDKRKLYIPCSACVVPCGGSWAPELRLRVVLCRVKNAATRISFTATV